MNLVTFNFWRVLTHGRLNWIGHILRRNSLLQKVIEGKIKGWIEVTRRRGRRRRSYWMTLGKERILSFEGESSRSHYVESWLWERLWICRKTDCWMNELTYKTETRCENFGEGGGINSVFGACA